VPDVPVEVYSASGAKVVTATSGPTGEYETTTGLPTGTYYARTAAAWRINQVYQGINCAPAACPPATTGTPIGVTAGRSTGGIRFELVSVGRIAGTVTVAGGAPLAGVTVAVLDGSGTSLGATTTGADGSYLTDLALGTGSYYVRTSNSLGYVDRIFGGGPCPGAACVASSGTPVAVTIGETTSGIDFVLAPGGAIAGTVTTSAGGEALPGVTVGAFDATGRSVGSGVTNGLGGYTTSPALPTGTYFVRTVNAPGHVDQLYSGLPCASCVVTTGTPVTVTAPATTGGIDFVLAPALPAFTDDPLVPETTPVRLAHIIELRQAIATLRALHGLGAATWTDPTLVPRVTPVKAAHLTEMRSALADVYVAAGRDVPAWTPPTVAGGQTVVTAATIMELRAAIAAIW
jgi:hypothetical protein